ncbi:MAG: NAD-dependent epimerase/dehydratase family protein [Sphingomonadaceae bacterium]
MKVAITGAGGFVGWHLSRLLLEQGHDVSGLDYSADVIAPGVRAIAGDLGDKAARKALLDGGCDALVHLATVPGGAAEASPADSRRINIDAMYDLLEEVAAQGNMQGACPRVVYASSIAVLGDPLPVSGVDDSTPLSPRMIYGGHKAMMETAVAMMSNRAMIDGVTIRLPGILARPKGPSGMKSAFMSDLFHALRAGESFTCPTSAGATIWAQSVARCAFNFAHGLSMDSSALPPTRAVTLPAQRIAMGDLATEISRQCNVSPDLVDYAPDAELEAAFGAYPPLKTQAADKAGFAHDGNLANLVESALKTLR